MAKRSGFRFGAMSQPAMMGLAVGLILIVVVVVYFVTKGNNSDSSTPPSSTPQSSQAAVTPLAPPTEGASITSNVPSPTVTTLAPQPTEVGKPVQPSVGNPQPVNTSLNLAKIIPASSNCLSNNLVCGDMVAGTYKATIQPDGNFVIFNGERVIWTSNTSGKGKGPYQLKMQPDGNLILFDALNKVNWKTATSHKGTGPYTATMQADGDFTVVDSKNKLIWSSKTKGK